MRTRSFRFLAALSLSCACASCLPRLHAQQAPEFTNFQLLTNKEARLTLSAPIGRSYRIEVATNAQDWQGLFTFPTNITTSLQHTDSAAPYLPARLYRAAQLIGTNILSGDHVPTTNGDVVIRPLYHATFVLGWNGRFIYMNLPFTMTVDAAASAVRQFQPRVVYPYHFSSSDVNRFKQLVGPDLGIEVRLRKWY